MTGPADLTHRLEAVEARLTALEAQEQAPNPAAPEATVPDAETFWVLEGIQRRHPAPGAVYYAGSVELPAGRVDWQIGLPTERLLETDWTAFANALAALGHPVRLAILQAVMSGAATVSELAAGEGMGTTGQLYHHLHQLTAQGWLVAAGRGRYAIPPERVVPLLAVLAAAHR